ncbi:hypothetical protein KBI33_02550 [Candidatus Shapirobacteria bacterium]|nr:hypothetical protein [Candidatus Shapirobacteria bacterium]
MKKRNKRTILSLAVIGFSIITIIFIAIGQKVSNNYLIKVKGENKNRALRVSQDGKIVSDNSRTEYEEYIKPIIQYWSASQQEDGNFHDPLEKNSIPANQYGTSHLGASLVWYGLRTNQVNLIQKGIKAINWHIDHFDDFHRPFNGFAVAYAYNQLKTTSYFDEFIKNKWENYLREAIFAPSISKVNYESNWALMQAAFFGQLYNTNIESLQANSTNIENFLANKNYWLNYYEQFFNNTYHSQGIVDGGYTGDPGTWPTAYHSFSAALLSKYLADSPSPNKTAKEDLIKILDTTLKLMAPDGDIAYYGRSNEQSFVLASNILAFEYGAKIAKGNGDHLKSSWYKRAAQLSFERLKRYHRIGKNGNYINIVPKLDNQFDNQGLDYYANLPTYNGLTILLLAMAIDITSPDIISMPLPLEDQSSTYSYLLPTVGLSIIKNKETWMIIANGNLVYEIVKNGANNADLRYDTGLIKAKKFIKGKWHDLVLSRPYGQGARYSLMPRGFLKNGKAFIIQGESQQIKDYSVSMIASLRERETGKDLNEKIEIKWEITPEGIKLTLPIYPEIVKNIYIPNLFNTPPTMMPSINSFVLSDSVHELLVNSNNIVFEQDPVLLNNSEIGNIYFDRFEIANQDRKIIITYSLYPKENNRIVLYWRDTPIDKRIKLEEKYHLKWINHANLPKGMTLATARALGFIGNNYWPAYAVYECEDNAKDILDQPDFLLYKKPPELDNNHFLIYWGSTNISQINALEKKYQLKWEKHAGLPENMTLSSAREKKLIGNNYRPAYSVYKGNPLILDNPDLKIYAQPIELR